MSQRISHSLLDPYLTLPIKAQYRRLCIPHWFPPEGIVLIGHLFAILGGVGLGFSTHYWWGGLLAAIGIAGNHIADLLDGTHARATGQCRNGGELLDHFTDPLSFSYWLIGIAASCGRLDLGLAAVVGLYATAVLTNIKAKLTGEFTLSAFGPTEFKTLLISYGLLMMTLTCGFIPLATSPRLIAVWSFTTLIVIGIGQLLVQLYRAVIEVNRQGKPADTTEWETIRATNDTTPSKPVQKKKQCHSTSVSNKNRNQKKF